MNEVNEKDKELPLWFSSVTIDFPSGLIKMLSEFYSKNFGKYFNTKKRIKVSPYKFCSLHFGETAYFCSDSKGDILGLCIIDIPIYIGRLEIGIITNLIIDKKYRKRGLATSLLKYALYTIDQDNKKHGYNELYVGMYTVNPISLWTLEKIPGVSYINLYDNPEIKNSLQRYFIDQKGNDIDARFKFISDTILENCSGIDIYQNAKELDEYNSDLINWYSGLMGKLEKPNQEWFLLTKVEGLDEFKLDN